MTVHTNRGGMLETALEKVGRSLSKRFGITLICQGNKCCTNGKTIYLPSLPDDVPNELLQVIRGWLDHEVAHHTEKTEMKLAGEFRARLGPDAFFLLNILEDLRVEEGMRMRFPGSGYNLARCYEFAVAEAEKGDPLPIMRQLAFAIHTRACGHADVPFVDPGIYNAVKLVETHVAQASACATTKQVADLAEDAWRILEPLLARQREAQHTPSPAPENTPAHENQSQSNPITATEKTWRNSGPKATKSQQAKVNGAATNTNSDRSLGGILGDLGDAIAEQVQRHAENDRSYRVWSTARDKVTTATTTSFRTHRERMAAVLPHVGGVRQRLLQTLLAEPKARWRGDLEEGDINPRALHRLVCPVPGRESNPRVFRRRVRTKKLETAVMLLIDESNSMRHGRLRLAAETALVFCEALSRLHIASGVVGFSTSSADANIIDARKHTGLPEDLVKQRYRTMPLVHTMYKRFDEEFAAVSGRMDGMSPKSLTPLGESMLFAARELAARREERKVLFVLTDGKPVVGIDPEGVTFSHAKAAIKRIESTGIDVALLGIMEPSVFSLHHCSVVINRLDELPRTAMRQLQKVLSR